MQGASYTKRLAPSFDAEVYPLSRLCRSGWLLSKSEHPHLFSLYLFVLPANVAPQHNVHCMYGKWRSGIL